jgi:hypothetical protein
MPHQPTAGTSGTRACSEGQIDDDGRVDDVENAV